MKITKNDLKKIILEAMAPGLEQQEEVPPPQAEAKKQTAREKTVARGLETGGTMAPEEYANNLKAMLLSPKVSAQTRLKALESIFPGKGAQVNALIVALQKQMN